MWQIKYTPSANRDTFSRNKHVHHFIGVFHCCGEILAHHFAFKTRFYVGIYWIVDQWKFGEMKEQSAADQTQTQATTL